MVEPFWNAQRKYLYLDGRKYWHMGDPASSEEPPELINRSWVDVTLYRDEAERAGYQGEELAALLLRWQQLLRSAGQ